LIAVAANGQAVLIGLAQFKQVIRQFEKKIAYKDIHKVIHKH